MESKIDKIDKKLQNLQYIIDVIMLTLSKEIFNMDKEIE